MKIEFTATKGVMQGSGASRRLRRSGRIPGIVYGGTDAPQAVDMDHNELFQLMRKEVFYSSVLTMKLDGQSSMCLVRDVQRHPYKQIIMHLDFQPIDATHKIHQKIPLHFVGPDMAPGVKLQGGMVSHAMNDIDVTCLPADLPAYIEVDLKELAAGQSIHVSQLNMPKGVEVVHHGEGDPVVASITVKGGVKEEEVAPTVVAPAAPAKAEKKAERVDKR